MKKYILILVLLCIPCVTHATITEVQHPSTNSSQCSGTVASCTLTVSSTGAGHFGIVTVAVLSVPTTTVVSVTDNMGGVWTVRPECAASSGVIGTIGCAYNLTLPAGVTSITANWSIIASEGARLDFREYSYTSPFVQFDSAGVLVKLTGAINPIIGAVPGVNGSALTGTNDVIVQGYTSGSGSATGVSTYGNLNTTSYYGSADLLNTTSATAPQFTLTSPAVYAVAYIAISEIQITQSIYIAQTAAGAANGTSCANAYAYTFFNTVGNWASTNTAGKISPDTEVWTCGMITTGGLWFKGSGIAGSPIILYIQPGSSISLAYCGSGYFDSCLAATTSYIIVDGGIPCGAGTTCAALEAANPTGYVTGQAGIIEATANGTGLANQSTSSNGVYLGTSTNVEIRNLILRNGYQHTLATDETGGATDWPAIDDVGNYCDNCSFHDMTIHDWLAGYQNSANDPSSPENGIFFYNNNLFNYSWGIYDGSATGVAKQNLFIHDNVFGSTANWNTGALDRFHHDRIFLTNVDTSGTLTGVYIYNNLFNGASGNCCNTAMIYFSSYSTNMFQQVYIFNNVFDDTNNSQTMGAIMEIPGAVSTGINTDTKYVFNNTVIGGLVGSTQVENQCYQVAGGITFENNVGSQCLTNILDQVPTTYTAIDYNAYNYSNAIELFQSNDGATKYTSLGTWQSYTGGEAHSNYYSALNALNLNSFFAPNSGSPLIGAATNLTSLCTGYLVSLCSTTSTGNTVIPIARPTTGAWSIGAFAGGVVSLSPTSNNFGLIVVGLSSSSVTFSLTNNSAATATSVSPTVMGGNTGDFPVTNSGSGSCNALSGALTAGSSCTFTVKFSPSAVGPRSTTLSVSYSGGDGASPRTAPLSGTGVVNTYPAPPMSLIVVLN